MKVRENTPERLRISGFPFGLALGLAGVMAVPGLMSFGYFRAGMLKPGFFLAGLALLLLVGCFGVFVRHRSVVFDRTSGTITLVERGILGTKRQVRTLEGLQGASVQTQVMKPDPNRDYKRGRRPPDRRVFRPLLVYVGGRTEPVYEIYAGNGDASTVAAAINGWVGGGLAPP